MAERARERRDTDPEYAEKQARRKRRYYDDRESVAQRARRAEAARRRRQRIAPRRTYWIHKYKTGKGCAHCGFDKHGTCLDLHHLNPDEKDLEVSKLMRGSLRVLMAEIRKCIVLCANCHRIEHARLRCEAANDN